MAFEVPVRWIPRLKEQLDYSPDDCEIDAEVVAKAIDKAGLVVAMHNPCGRYQVLYGNECLSGPGASERLKNTFQTYIGYDTADEFYQLKDMIRAAKHGAQNGS